MGELKYSFEKLDVYIKAREFRKKIYGLVKKLPKGEEFALAPQMRRAAISLTNNIAEGHGRFHFQESIQFFRHSRGSLQELLDDINICIDEQYSDIEKLELLKREGFDLLHSINGFIAYMRNQKLRQSNQPPTTNH